MAVLSVKIPLSETSLIHLNEVVESENAKNKTEYPVNQWALRQVLNELKSSAVLLNQLEENGKIELSKDKVITPKDLKPYPLVDHTEGTLELKIGEYTQKRIEKVASFINAINNLQGLETPWKNSNEWIEKVISQSISSKYAQLTNSILDEEEKQNYSVKTNEKKD